MNSKIESFVENNKTVIAVSIVIIILIFLSNPILKFIKGLIPNANNTNPNAANADAINGLKVNESNLSSDTGSFDLLTESIFSVMNDDFELIPGLFDLPLTDAKSLPQWFQYLLNSDDLKIANDKLFL